MAKRCCRHCKEVLSREQKECSICDCVPTDQCMTCHQEVAHDKIRVQNIHICGAAYSGLDGIDQDPDAYGRADLEP